MAKIRLTPKQKEALSHTPLHMGQSEADLNHISWGSNWGKHFYSPLQVDKLIDKGLLKFKENISKFRTIRPDETIVVLTDLAKEMGFIENADDFDTIYTLGKTSESKAQKPLVPGQRKSGKLYKELDVLLEVSEKMEFKQASEFLRKLIYTDE